MGHNVVKILDSRIGFTNIVKVSIQHLITSDINFYRKYKIRIWYSTSVGVKFWCNKDCFIWVDIIFHQRNNSYPQLTVIHSKIKDKLPSLSTKQLLTAMTIPQQPLILQLSNMPDAKHLLQISSQAKRWHVEKWLYFVFCTYLWLNWRAIRFFV